MRVHKKAPRHATNTTGAETQTTTKRLRGCILSQCRTTCKALDMRLGHKPDSGGVGYVSDQW